MTTPKTLLEMSGADMRPASLTGATLVIIDAQNEYLDGKLALPGARPAVDALAKLLAKARAAGAPVVHVQHKGRAGGLFDLEARGGAIIDAVKPIGSEAIVHKPLPNAFAQTELDATLKRLGRTQLVIAGFMTHMCVSSTARAALDLGYKATVAADAAATRDLPDPMGGVIAADALHRAALAELADRFAIVAKVEQILGGMTQGPQDEDAMSPPAKTRAAELADAGDRPRVESGRAVRQRGKRGGAVAASARASHVDIAGLEEFVGYVVRRAQVWIFQDVRRTLKEHDITPAQFAVMKVVGANAGLAQVRVAEALSIERARLVQMLDQLEERGLIKRTRSTIDRRTHALHLSREGTALLEKLVALMQEHERRVVARMGSKGKSELLRILAPFLR